MPATASLRLPTAARTANEPSGSWVVHGVIAGLIGASVIALFFLVLDLEAGQPLHTPQVLGAWLFRGELPAPGTPVEAPLVGGYTAVHGVVFLGFGLAAAFEALSGVRRVKHEFLAGALAALVLFACFELVFGVLGALFTPVVGALGGGRVLAANALAALAIAGYLARVRATYAAGVATA